MTHLRAVSLRTGCHHNLQENAHDPSSGHISVSQADAREKGVRPSKRAGAGENEPGKRMHETDFVPKG